MFDIVVMPSQFLNALKSKNLLIPTLNICLGYASDDLIIIIHLLPFSFQHKGVSTGWSSLTS